VIEELLQRYTSGRADRALIFLAALLFLMICLPAFGLWPYGAAVEAILYLAGAFVTVILGVQGKDAVDLRTVLRNGGHQAVTSPPATKP